MPAETKPNSFLSNQMCGKRPENKGKLLISEMHAQMKQNIFSNNQMCAKRPENKGKL